MTKHTPGPWTTEESVKRPNVFYVHGPGEAYYLAEVKGKRNAQLIAAAPELLEACAAFVATGSNGDPNDLERALDCARAAIAKATG